MSHYRMRVVFSNSERYGWTETWNLFNQDAVIQQRATAAGFVQRRARLLPGDCSIARVVIQGLTKRNPVVVDFENVGYAHGQFPGSINSTDDAIIVRLQAAGVGYNRIFLRGIPDDMISGEQISFPPAWLDDWNAFVNYVAFLGNFCVVSILGSPQTPIAGAILSSRDPKGIKASVPAGSSLTVGSQVRVSGASVPGYNGVHGVLSNDGFSGPSTLYSLGAGKMIVDNPPTDQVVLTPLVAGEGAIDTMNLEQFTVRKAGRPFGQRRGRARTLLTQRP